MKYKKTFVVGAFGYINNQLDGQTIKTRNVYRLLETRYKGQLSYFDTLQTRKKPLSLFQLIFQLLICRRLILMPCRGNLTFFFPFAFFMSKILRFEIIIICIGGWQYEYFTGIQGFKKHTLQMKCCKAIKAHLPEMQFLHSILVNHCGFKNSEVFPNFRFFQQMPIVNNQGALRLVFMARIRQEKGYPMVFEALDKLKGKGVNVSMTFYGQINDADKDHFFSLLDQHKDNCTYEGELNPANITERLNQYDIMLFPTHYFGEGFPGTILDSFIAGIAVIATEWKHAREFIEDGKVGYIVPIDSEVDVMVEKILYLDQHRDILKEMKQNSLEEANKYSDEVAWEVLSKYLQ